MRVANHISNPENTCTTKSNNDSEIKPPRSPMTGRQDDRDHPLSCRWRLLTPDAYDALDLPPVRSKAMAVTRAQIIAEAYVIGRDDRDSWISYSRRDAFYTARRGRYWPKTFTYSAVVAGVDQLVAIGLLDHQKMAPGHRGEQSRFKASAKLLKLLNEKPVAIIHEPREEIVLRDNDGNWIDYTETEQSSRRRQRVQEINNGIVSPAIGLQGRTICEGDPVEVDGVRIGAASNQLYRVIQPGQLQPRRPPLRGLVAEYSVKEAGRHHDQRHADR